MPFSRGRREQIRCVNPDCKSVKSGGPNGGRVLLETVGGFLFKEVGGDKVGGMFWIYAECGICHVRRFNPLGVAFDGMGLPLEKTLQAAAARADEEAEAEAERQRLAEAAAEAAGEPSWGDLRRGGRRAA